MATVRDLLLRLLRLDDATSAERRAAFWTAVAFFWVLFSYYLLRPLRENVGTAFGKEQLLGLFTLTFVLTTLLNQPYMWLVRRLPSHRFLPYGLHAFAASFVVLAAVYAGGDGKLGPLDWSSWRGCSYALFYSWVTAFSVCGVTLIWVHAVEWFSLAQGKRLFGLVSVGGTFGAMLGSLASQELRERSYPELCLLGALGIEIAVATWWLSLRACRRMGRERAERSVVGGSGFLDGLARVARDPYLRGIAAFVLLAAVVATTFYYQRIAVLVAQVPDESERRAVEASINFWQNALCLGLQLFFTSRALLWFGVGVVLCAMPLTSLVGLSVLTTWPVVAVYGVVEVARRMVQFAFDKPAREVLYTPLDPEAKYVSKAVIDTAVLRTGDLLGAVINNVVTRLSGGTLLALALPVIAVWLGLGRWLGANCQRRASAN